MADIVLTTLNAKYIHSSFGLRYLLANLGELRDRARTLEFDINQRILNVAERILELNPRIIGIGVYIWNASQTTELVATLKRIQPDTLIVLGGPEVSYEWEQQAMVASADYVITGEAELEFARFCRTILAGGRPAQKIIHAAIPQFSEIELPYDLYREEDVAHRIVYVEASRGCPFTCEFCLSSLDIPVRQAPLGPFLEYLDRLLARGVTQFKFVDRTFNLNLSVSKSILEFCLARHKPGRFFHFEMIPDRLPNALRDVISRFPAGALQFEVGVQTFNPEVAERIQRKQNYKKLEDNLRFLRASTGVHIHADLIFGLPGETLESFATGFDRLWCLRPQEIQVGILKRLRGTPIVRHDAEWEMVYSPHPPYEILRNRLIDFPTLQRVRRFARYWDLIGNSGNFIRTTRLLMATSGSQTSSQMASPFYSFLRLSDWLHKENVQTDGVALVRLMHFLFRYLTTDLRLEPKTVAESLWQDYRAGARRDKPAFLKDYLRTEQLSAATPSAPDSTVAIPKRQRRHTAQSR